jgi:hypothetical protein
MISASTMPRNDFEDAFRVLNIVFSLRQTYVFIDQHVNWFLRFSSQKARKPGLFKHDKFAAKMRFFEALW